MSLHETFSDAVPFILLLALFLGGMVFSNWQGVVFHENAHKQIFEYYGANASEIKVNVNWNWADMAFGGDTKANVSMAEWKEMRAYHALNEIVGYNMQGIQLAILFVGFMISFSIILVKWWD